MIEFAALKVDEDGSCERFATAEEIAAHFRIKIVSDRICEIEADKGYKAVDPDPSDY